MVLVAWSERSKRRHTHRTRTAQLARGCVAMSRGWTAIRGRGCGDCELPRFILYSGMRWRRVADARAGHGMRLLLIPPLTNGTVPRPVTYVYTLGVFTRRCTCDSSARSSCCSVSKGSAKLGACTVWGIRHRMHIPRGPFSTKPSAHGFDTHASKPFAHMSDRLGLRLVGAK